MRCLLFAGWCACAAAAAGAGDTTGTLIRFTNPHVRLDTLIEGDKRPFSYSFVNVSGDSVRIVDVRANCGCTAVRPDSTVYAPGDSGVLQAEYHSAGFAGAYTKHVYVSAAALDGEATAASELALSVYVKREIAFEPISLYALKLDPAAPFSREVLLYNRTADTITVREMTVADSIFVSVNCSRPLPVKLGSGESVPFTVALTTAVAREPPEHIRTVVSILTAGAKYPRRNFPVRLFFER